MAKRKRDAIIDGKAQAHPARKAQQLTNGHASSMPKSGQQKTITASRKHVRADTATGPKPSKISKTENHVDVKTELPSIQIITGSYERTLHGFTTRLTLAGENLQAQFADSFLFNAHQSAVKCLALSPMPETADEGVYLATGGSDERINIYSISPAPVPDADSKGRKLPSMPTLGPNQISENPMNRELGTLVHHASGITSLHFSSRSKLLSASEDNTISVTRLRDLEVVSTVKAPIPKASGQASGDSASAGTVPAGVNDFAIHPSMKLMVSVGRGERCMRLWNLVTGKKAGVLNFQRKVLDSVKEGKYSHGEGRKIRWNRSGDEFAVTFERGVVVFGQDVQPKCALMPRKLTKIHQVAYFGVSGGQEYLAVSTDSGEILFFDTTISGVEGSELPVLQPVSYTGGTKHSIKTRIKDFQIMDLTTHGLPGRLIVAGSSNGDVRLITVTEEELRQPSSEDGFIGSVSSDVHQTGNRITCLVAFVMLPAHDVGAGLSESEGASGSGPETDSEDD